MTDTHDLSRIAILVPGKLSDHAGKRIDRTFDMVRMDSADPARITPELAARVRGIAAFGGISAAFMDALPKLEQIIQLTRNKVLPLKIIQRIEAELLSILKRVRGRAHEKVEVFRNRLYKLRAYITTCLRNPLVPPTNNMSERALRSTKVKMRVSSLFRTMAGAQDYAILRSIIDSAILQGKHPFDALVTPDIVVN